MEPHIVEPLLVIPVLAIAYLAPSIIAVLRGHNSWLAITSLNILAGWTVLGYIISLVWSFTGNTRRIDVRRARRISKHAPG